MRESSRNTISRGRIRLVVGVLTVSVLLLLWRAIDLHIFNRSFLQNQGDARYLRLVSIPAHRGMVTDRHGEPLAISTPVDSVWANPQILAENKERYAEIARPLGLDPRELARLLEQRKDREFVYLQRHLSPEHAKRVVELGIPGVFAQREYKRYYPTGEVAAHVVGFTNIDDVGLEGAELAWDQWLRGTPGSKRVVRDRLGRIVEDVESISEPQPGRDLRLSIDRRLQYLAYRELKAAVQRNRAKSASAVLLDARTGEVLAMVNQPAYNPNNPSQRGGASTRNRAVTDIFEPGSTIKPFTIVAALESGRFRSDSTVDTRPGFLRVGNNTIRDHKNHGLVDVATVIKKSSNVGSARIALALEPDRLWKTLRQVGFGEITGSSFPGEANGLLAYRKRWNDTDRASLSFGYGLSVTALQLTQAYAVLAGDGRLRGANFLAVEGDPPAGVAAINGQVALQVRAMLEGVVNEGGTGTRARVPGYRIAGKTGTARKVINGRYSEDRYVAVFAGMAPATRPRLVMVVVIDEPADAYYGGEVAAPVFSNVMAGALRMLDIPPDDARTATPAGSVGGLL